VAIFKSIPEKLRLLLMLVVAVSVLWVPVWAVINRITGSNIIDGNGLRFGTAVGGKDSLVVLPGYTMLFDGDSVEIDTTNLKSLFANYFVTLGTIQDIGGVKHFTDTLATGTQGTDGIFKIYSEQGGTDFGIVFKPHATMTQTTVYLWPANDGDASQFLQSDGAGNLTWATPSGSGDMLKATYDVLESGVVDDVDTIGTQIAAALSYRTTPAAVSALLGDSLGDYLTSTVIAAWIGDSLGDYLTATAIGAILSDSMWNPTFLPRNNSLAIGEGLDDSVSVLYPLRSGVISWAVKHINESGAAADQMDTVVFSWILPAGVPDVDSITFNLRTSSADTAVSGLRVRCFKQTAELGAKTALTATLIGFFTATDAWEHKTIAGASIGAIAGGNELSIEMCVQTDAAAVVWHDEPKVWCMNKQ